MVIDVKPILGVGLAAQSAALALKNVELLKKKKKKAEDFLKTGVINIAGISILGTQASIIKGL